MFEAATLSASSPEADADAEAMRALSTGDETAFTRLYRAHRDGVYRVAWGILLDDEEARDVVQETFLELHQAAASWRPEAQLFSWLYRVAVNRSFSVRRRLKRLVEGLWAAPVAAPSIESQLAHAETLGGVAHALRRLPARQRAVVSLYLERDLKPAEMAPLVGLTANATRVTLHRALQRVRAELEARGIHAAPVQDEPGLEEEDHEDAP